MKKIIKRTLLIIVLIALGYGIHYCWVSFPIISGFGAKQMCSCMFVSGRTEQSVDTGELTAFPLNLGSYKVNIQDSSVTGSVLGFAKKKAIYRKGIGCTVINDISEDELRAQTFSIPSPPAINTDTLAWPYGDKIADTILASVNKNALQAAIDSAFAEPGGEAKKRTRVVLVVYKGQIIAEKYAPGFTQQTKMYGWSMAKSVTGALIGTLVKQGKLDINQPAPVPEWSNTNDPRHAITIQNLLQQSTGLNFLEDYTKASDVTNMLYKEDNMAAFTANHQLAGEPGTIFSYSSGNSNILARIIRQTVGEKDYAAYPYNALFYKLGMYHTLCEPDASGTYVGSSYIMATARDYARFGLFYLNDGVWNNERILPQGWVKQTITPAPASKEKKYGYQFWLNGFQLSDPTKHIFPDAPADMFYADGYAGQFIYIIPSKQLVIVRLRLTIDRSMDENAFIKSFVDAVE